MDHEVMVFAQVMAVIVGSVAGFVGIGLAARMLWRMGSRVKSRAPNALDEDRIQRLEHAVDAIAIEVERISEGQRYAVGLLAERLPPRTADRVGDAASSGAPKRVNTPH